MSTQNSALLTDLYQLTMLQAYHAQNMRDTAVFEFFVRALPNHRNFLLAAGLEQVLQFLENLSFTTKELDWLADSDYFTEEFVRYLADLRFTGDVDAMPEGSVFFANEPIVRVTAALPEAQLIESRVINLLHFQTLIASKAARCVLVAPGKLLVDFGLRRAHGAEAGLLAARANFIAGFSGTATVLAGQEFGIPIYGTMAHSFVQAHDDEFDAFEQFARSQPNNVVLLIDTYDTEAAAQKIVILKKRLHKDGIVIKAVRLDSGDLAAHAHKVRRILDAGDCHEIRIFSSGNLDEYRLQEMISKDAPIDGFGIGTHLDTSNDAPYLDCAYKLMEYAGTPRRKRSEGKATLPGRKQVYRHYTEDGLIAQDILTLENDKPQGEPLLRPMMRGGKRLHPAEPLDDIRTRAAKTITLLPDSLRSLGPAAPYPVIISTALHDLTAAVDRDSTPALSSSLP